MRFLNNMKIGKKILFALGVMVILLVAAILVIYFNLNSVSLGAKEISNIYIPLNGHAENFETAINDTMYNIRGYGMTGESEYLAIGEADIEKANNDLDNLINLASAIDNDYVKDLMDVKDLIVYYNGLVDQTTEKFQEIDAIRTSMDEYANLLLSEADKYLISQEEMLADEFDNEIVNPINLERTFAKVTLINDIKECGNSIIANNYKFQATDDETYISAGATDFKKIYSSLSEIIDLTLRQVNLDQIEVVATAVNNYKSSIEEYMEVEEALSEIDEKRSEISDRILTATKTVSDTGVSAIKEKSNNTVSGISLSLLILIVLIAFAVVIGLVFFILITRGISKALKNLVAQANKLATGDLNIDFEVTTKDEIGDLTLAFERLVNSLNETLTEINVASDQVNAGAGQVSDGSQELSQGSTEQASSVEELTASVTQIASQTKENADNAIEASRLTNEVKSNAITGNEQMTGMLSSMKEINDSSQSISKIIKVIDDIAFQTNLLALNAAVEAARAGQHGRGFAVVAEEVRNLAARSANAAKDTTALIEGSIEKVDAGTKIANETAKALEEIVNGVEKATTLVAQISTASNQQATGVSQINEGLEQVSKVVQSNSATAEQSAAASEELSSQAELLKERVAKFKLREDMTQNRIVQTPRKNVRQIEKVKEPIISLDDGDFGKY